jgi:hypothetical protein
MSDLNSTPQPTGPITLILFLIANLFGALGLTMSDLDLILAIVLKFVSITSFVIMIIINWHKLRDKFKNE